MGSDTVSDGESPRDAAAWVVPLGPLEVERHQPERSWQTPVVASICCSCCCCCCCCAHTVGAIAGAMTGSAGSLAKSLDDREARRGALSATAAYWGGFGALLALCIGLAFLMDEVIVALILLAIFLPIVQFFGSLFALPAILLQPTAAGRRAAAGAIGTATLGWLIGGVLGTILVAGLVVLALGVAGASS